MVFSHQTLQKVRELAYSALVMLDAWDPEDATRTAIRFATAQPPAEIILDGNSINAVAVDIASVFDRECCYRQIEGPDGSLLKVETMQVLSIVITGDDVLLCKSTYDVIPASSLEKEKFINARYWTTTLDDLTENYIC